MLAALSFALSGCGGVEVSGAATAIGRSADGLLEPAAAGSLRSRLRSRSSTARSWRWSQAGGRVGPFKVSYVSEDDSSPDERAVGPRRDRLERQDGRRRHDHDRLPGRLQLGGHRGVAAADQRGGILQVSTGQPLCGADVVAGRRAGRARTLLPERAAHVRAPAARRSGAGGRPGEADGSMGVHKLYVLNDQDPFEIPLARSSPATPNVQRHRGCGRRCA